MPHTNNKNGERSYGRPRSSGAERPKFGRAAAGGGRGGGGGAAGQWKGKKAQAEAAYDEEARLEYLTGFSKRKKERTEAARARAVKRGQQEKRDLRKQLRDSRKGQAQTNVEEQANYYGTDAFAPEASGSEAGEAETNDREYEDERAGRRTTVTVQEFTVDHDELDDPPSRPRPQPIAPHAPPPQSRPPRPPTGGDRRPKSSAGTNRTGGKKVKAKRVPYESKATRTIERAKKERKREAKKEGKPKSKRR